MSAPKRIAVLVSGGGTNLQALIDAQNRGEIVNGEIATVISSAEGAFALERAAKAGIPGYVMARKSFDSNRAMTMALVEKLKELNIDLVVLAGFMVILTEEMVQTYPNAIVNVHPALIPSFCGPGYYAGKYTLGKPMVLCKLNDAVSYTSANRSEITGVGFQLHIG